MSPLTTSPTSKGLTLFPGPSSEKILRIAVWPGFLARCGMFRFTQLRSDTHPGPISWALGRWSQDCKLKVYLTSTPPLHSFLDTSYYMQVIVSINHTTASKESDLWPFLQSWGRSDRRYWDLVVIYSFSMRGAVGRSSLFFWSSSK